MTVLVRRRMATIARLEKDGWQRDGEIEKCVVTATLTDGRTVQKTAMIEYAADERHEIVKSLVEGAAAGREEWVGKFTRQVFLRRAKALEGVYGELQREYGCVPAVEEAS